MRIGRDDSGFIFDKHQIEFGSAGFKILPQEGYAGRIQMDINLLEETQHKKLTPDAYGQADHVSNFVHQHQ